MATNYVAIVSGAVAWAHWWTREEKGGEFEPADGNNGGMIRPEIIDTLTFDPSQKCTSLGTFLGLKIVTCEVLY